MTERRAEESLLAHSYPYTSREPNARHPAAETPPIRPSLAHESNAIRGRVHADVMLHLG